MTDHSVTPTVESLRKRLVFWKMWKMVCVVFSVIFLCMVLGLFLLVVSVIFFAEAVANPAITYKDMQ